MTNNHYSYVCGKLQLLLLIAVFLSVDSSSLSFPGPNPWTVCGLSSPGLCRSVFTTSTLTVSLVDCVHICVCTSHICYGDTIIYIGKLIYKAIGSGAAGKVLALPLMTTEPVYVCNLLY